MGVGTRSRCAHRGHRQDVPYRRSQGRRVVRWLHGRARSGVASSLLGIEYNAYNSTYAIQNPKAYLLDVTLSCLNPFDIPSVPLGCALPLIQNRMLPILEIVTTDSGRNEIWLMTADSRSLFLSRVNTQKLAGRPGTQEPTMTGWIIATSPNDGAGWKVDRISFSSPLSESADPMDIR